VTTRDGPMFTCRLGLKCQLLSKRFDSLREAKLRVTQAIVAQIPEMEQLKEKALAILDQP
jgi:hypothetical protein